MDIKHVLQEQGVSIEELARRMGVNRQTIYFYIKQRDKNPLSQLERIAAALGIDVTELFDHSPTNTIICPKCGTRLEVKEKE